MNGRRRRPGGSDPARLSARRDRRSALWVTLVSGVGILLLSGWQLARLNLGTHSAPLLVVQLALTAYLLWQFVFAHLERPARVPSDKRAELLDLQVVALVPVYNEDPRALRACLASFLDQTRTPQAVCVVDDGSTTGGYGEVRAWFEQAAADAGVRAHWVRQDNAGKRHAQAAGLRLEPDADIYLTVDSDSVLDPKAVAECLKAFADPEVQSVAAVVLTTNYRANLLTRMVDLYCVSLQLFERSALSRWGAVLVNCGGCAFYRAPVIWENLHTYLGETLFGRPMNMSDDSLLTLFALERGRAVQQPSAFAFTLMPETFSHHRRQQLRWMRGSFIRSGWRLRRLPTGRAAYWLHLAKWVQFTVMTVILALLLASGALFHPLVLVWALGSAAVMYTVVASRYLTVRRSDQSTWQRWAVMATAPLAAVWSQTVLRVLRWWAMATFVNLGWGTRAKVEVAA